MLEKEISINYDICKACKACTEICPQIIFRWGNDEKVFIRQDRKEICFECGQCMAVCSSMAIKVGVLNYENDFIPSPKETITEPQFMDFLLSRRAVRNYKDKPVPKELLEKIVYAIKTAPPGFPPLKTELTIINDKDLIKQSLPYMINFYNDLLEALKNPVKRFIIRKSAGIEAYQTLINHLVPLMEKRLPQMNDGSEDTITRHAPAMIIFHADKFSDNFRTDINIASAYGILALHAFGLGGTIIDLIPPAINRTKKLKEMFQIPDNNDVVSAIILGYPKFKYRRAIKRELKSVSWI